MDAALAARLIVRPALDWLALRSPERAAPLMLAIGYQESNWTERRQIGGPARGFWQFEGGPMSGTAQVLTHPASKLRAAEVCAALEVAEMRPAIYDALEHNDLLAGCFARLLLLPDPRPLPDPVAEAEEEAWAYYVRNWHPGKPHRGRWTQSWAIGLAAALTIAKAS